MRMGERSSFNCFTAFMVNPPRGLRGAGEEGEEGLEISAAAGNHMWWLK